MIALDWGTTSCRAFLLGDDGGVLAERRQQSGVKALTASAASAGTPRTQAFEGAFEQLCGDWLETSPKLPVIACGMVGSNRGWVETPYRSLPVDLIDNGFVMTTFAARDGSVVHIIPGLIADQNVPDVIRGEETQVLGALGESPWAGSGNSGMDRIVLLPGTHSKWVRVVGTTVTAFKTFMTGEFFALLTTESTLSQLATPSGQTDWEAFDKGLDVAASAAGGGGILSTAFSARTFAMTGGLAADQVEDYLSGLLIGDEVAAAASLWQGVDVDEVLICGEADLSERYRRALVKFALPTPREISDSAATGMWRIAVAAGLVAHREQSHHTPPASPATATAPLRSTHLPRARKLTESSSTMSRTYIGLIAILRGLTVSDAVSVGECLYEAGFRTLEVPLNSPDPLPTISALEKVLPANCMVGAGTVVTVEQVRQCHEAGAQIIVSPNTDVAVIAETIRLGMLSFPGTATPSDAFAAIGAGATSVKIFPANQVGINGLKAWTAVVPKEIGLIPVGGVDAANIGEWMAAGATGFGIGSSLYKPGIAVEDLRQRAVAMIAAWDSALDSTRKSE
ncbi:2-dehydro-3-deoxy-6-phosphogalactonate aldolase [Cryobacterium fucosi]|nr:2-dehydro-3-deoxy-6-phosphogalactonate aldolase [Cryobacterium fucosi]